MPWCPQCGAEYREGFTHCPHCDVELVKARPLEPPPVLPEAEWVLLTNSADNVETQLIRGVLRGEKIPFVTKERGDGAVNMLYTGASFYGTDFYVEQSWLEQARQVLDACFTPLDDAALVQIGQDAALLREEPVEQDAPQRQKADVDRRKYAAWIALAALLLAVLLRFR